MIKLLDLIKKSVKRALIAASMFKGVMNGNVIVIEDRNTTCKTFVGSRINQDRFKFLILNLIR